MDLDRNMAFKGGRTYLHSTTVVDDILQLRQGVDGRVDFKFDKRTARQVRYLSELPAGVEPVATWRDGQGMIYVVERNEPIVLSTAYDEDALAERFVFSDQQVMLVANIGDASFIEAVVAGFKALLQRTVAGKASKLAFVRLRLSRLPGLPVEIHYSRKIGEFFQGDILADGEPVGQIFFGEWR